MSFASLRSCALVLLFAAPVAFCNPRITIGDPPGGSPVNLDFSFNADSAGGGFFTFTNNSSQNWTTLDFFFVETPSTVISCSSPIFDVCNITSTPINSNNTSFDVGFEGTSNSPGILAGASFTINLDNSGTATNGSGDWCPDTHFTAEANVPEPSYAAAVAGFALLALLGAVRRNRRNRLLRCPSE